MTKNSSVFKKKTTFDISTETQNVKLGLTYSFSSFTYISPFLYIRLFCKAIKITH